MTCMNVNKSTLPALLRNSATTASGSEGRSYLSISGRAIRSHRPRTRSSAPATIQPCRLASAGSTVDSEIGLVDDILFVYRVQAHQRQQLAEMIKHFH